MALIFVHTVSHAAILVIFIIIIMGWPRRLGERRGALPCGPAPSHRLSPSLPNPPIAPASLCDAISGVMPGPSGQGCCSYPSDITPACDGPAHAYPDNAVDCAARANRTSQYNAPSSGVMKPVCSLTDRLPDPLTSDLGREPQEQ